MTVYLELADYLLIAERVLGLPAEAIASFDRIGLADSALAAPQAGFGGVEAYAEFETQAAVLCWHLVKIRCPTATSAARSWRPWSLLSAMVEGGWGRRGTRRRPIRSSAPSRAAR